MVEQAGDRGAPDRPLHPRNSLRQYWRDPATGVLREIWRPGDGDGDMTLEHFDIKMPPKEIKTRWRLYQLSTGPYHMRIHEPPNNVILDDRAAYEILQSNIPRAQLYKRWSHDFTETAKIRNRRPHRGRPAFKDADGDGIDLKYFNDGNDRDPYYFIGQKEFIPVYYSQPTPEPVTAALAPAPMAPLPKPKQHNQYTAPELLVRNGAESQSKTKGKYRARVNTFLRRTPSPPWVKDRERMYGGASFGSASALSSHSLPSPTSKDFDFSLMPSHLSELMGHPSVAKQEVDSMWVTQDNIKEEEDDEATLPSVFDRRRGGGQNSTGKRSATTELPYAWPKVPKQMNYIERIAAGMVEEELQAANETTGQTVGDVDDFNIEYVHQLEDELHATREQLSAKTEENADLKRQVEELQTLAATERSLAVE